MVMHQQTLDQLAELKPVGFKQALVLQTQSPSFMQMAFEERLAHLVDAEVISQNNRRIKRYLRAAKLKYKNAFLKDIEYNASRNLDQGQIKSLAKNQWIDHVHHIIITGATGTGKTYIACALAQNAIAWGYTAFYVRISKLLSEIKLARADGSYLSWLKKISRKKSLSWMILVCHP